MQRQLARVITLAAAHPGQFGEDHTVVEVIEPDQWLDADPFILLMDDRVDGVLRAGKHPHAGFETVTYLVAGEMNSESGDARLTPGDVEWTTAGSGIVHGPERPIEGKMRVLQLWVTLPQKDRWTAPDHQFIRAKEAPLRREPGAELRLFSGVSGTLRSATRNRVPMIVADIRLQKGAKILQEAPPSYNGFFYLLDGEARVGGTLLEVGQVGWLDRPQPGGAAEIEIASSGERELHLLFYAGERQEVPIVSYGPFIGDTREDIVRSIQRYQTGTFPHY